MSPKSIPKEELLICIPHLYNNLEDRNADVRKNASEAILGIMIHLGYEAMLKQTEKLKPGSKNVIVAALEKVRPNLPVKALPKKIEKEDKVVKGAKQVPNSKNPTRPKVRITFNYSSIYITHFFKFYRAQFIQNPPQPLQAKRKMRMSIYLPC